MHTATAEDFAAVQHAVGGPGSWALWAYMTLAQVYKAIITGLCFTSVFICISNSAPNAKKVKQLLTSNCTWCLFVLMLLSMSGHCDFISGFCASRIKLPGATLAGNGKQRLVFVDVWRSSKQAFPSGHCHLVLLSWGHVKWH